MGLFDFLKDKQLADSGTTKNTSVFKGDLAHKSKDGADSIVFMMPESLENSGWICPECETFNKKGNNKGCIVCGYVPTETDMAEQSQHIQQQLKPEHPPQKRGNEPHKKKQAERHSVFHAKWLFLLLVPTLLVVGILLGLKLGESKEKTAISIEASSTPEHKDNSIYDENSHVHSWTTATCTEAKKCSICGTSEGTALGHQWVEATCATSRTCIVCGYLDGEPNSHQWIDATCTDAKKCAVCELVDGEPNGHQWVDATCTEAKKCTVCELTDGEPNGHQWVDATCTNSKKCATCGTTEGSPKGHQWVDATCTEARRCTVCSLTDGVPKGHQWTDTTLTTQQTCIVCKKLYAADDLVRDRLPIVTYAMGSVQYIYGFEDEALTQKNEQHYFDALNDQIVIMDVSADGSALKIRFPSSITDSGYHTLWFPFDDIISVDEMGVGTKRPKSKVDTYRYYSTDRKVMHYGSMLTGTRYYYLGVNDPGYVVIIYGIDDQVIHDVEVVYKLALITESGMLR